MSPFRAGTVKVAGATGPVTFAAMTKERPLALAVLCTAQFVDVMGVTIVVVALPTMRADLAATPTQVQLVVSVYAFLFGCLLLPAGRAADRWGRLRLFRGGLAGFGLGSVVCALAPTAEVLVGGRAVQGVSAAAVVPAALALVTATFTGDAERGRALAVWTAAGAGGGAFGLVAGGVVTDLVGWRWIFAANIPATLFSAVLARRVLPADPPVRPAGARRGALVPRGVLTLALVVACAVAFVNTATTSSTGTLVTLHAQDVEGVGPAGAGLLLLPFSLAVVLGSALGAPLLRVLGPRSAAVGLAIIGAGVVLCAAATGLSGAPAVALLPTGVAIAGTGLGIAAVASTATGTAGVPGEHLGVASGLINTATQLGTAVGTAALLGLADAVAARDSVAAGHRVAFLVAAGLAFVAAVAVAVTLSRRAAPSRQKVGAGA
jgi:MFS family permease